MSNIYITSDTHFFHKRIMEYCPDTRHGEDYLDMTVKLVEAWNSRVGPNDVVYHLGDVSFGDASLTNSILNELNGTIHLIKGNHDKGVDNHPRFASVQDYLELKIGKHHVVMCHFPFAVWNKAHYGSIHLHGHSHGGYKAKGRIMDVGVDTRSDMAPWSWNEIKERMEAIQVLTKHH